MKIIVEPYLSLIDKAVRGITYPPIVLVKLMFQESKQAQVQELKDLERQLENQRLEAEQAVTEMSMRHQQPVNGASDYQEAMKQLGESNDK